MYSIEHVSGHAEQGVAEHWRIVEKYGSTIRIVDTFANRELAEEKLRRLK